MSAAIVNENNNQQSQSQHNQQQQPSPVPTYVVAVPVYHENLYKIVKDNETWLGAGPQKAIRINTITIKRINTEEDTEKLESIITALRTEKSELFIDPEYRPKPHNMKIEDYVAEFIKNKSVGTHYTFKHFYQITVYPPHFTYDAPSVPTEGDDYEKLKWLELMNKRKEYLIIPLYIILKKGKTYEQMKTLSYNSDGSYNVHEVNPKHFYRPQLLDAQEEIDLKNKEMRETATMFN